ncbi:outer membrane beta-barrel family protein [Chitinophaga sp.]|uniref:outer membrane beta-barrel family protein n=1 Tax=Chitinophaga sp. TaxID=1869181 RepID=UPI0031D99ED2
MQKLKNNLNKAITLTVLPIFVFFYSEAQTIEKLTGRVTNGTPELIIGNVIILSVTDSSLIKGAAFLESHFEISGVNQKEVLVKLNSLQFPDTIFKVKFNGNPNIDLGTIRVGSSKFQLGEVQITSQLPLVQRRPNGIVEVNVAKTVLASSSSVEEILSRSPNVVVSDEGISVFGKGEAIIYLNGRRITAEQMAAIPVTQIVKIEVIPNPSAMYDAEGKAVINIKTKTNADEGILGSFSQQVTWSSFSGTSEQSTLNLNYRKGRVSLVGNYNLELGKDREILHTTRTRPAADDYLSSDLRTEWKRKYNNYSNYNLGVQYDLDAKSNISLQYDGYLEDLGGSQLSNNTIKTTDEDSRYNSGIAVDHRTLNHSLRLNYNREIDSLGSTLFAGTQYSYFNSDVDDFINEDGTINSKDTFRLLNNIIAHKITISSSQVDYTKVFNARNKLSIGAKYSYVNTNSDTRFLVGKSKPELTPKEDMSNNFEYTEQVPAAYISYGSTIGANLHLDVGVRSELTHYTLNTSVGGGQVIEDNYVNFFPNLGVNTTLDNGLGLRAAYTARITRPRYQSLNPFSIYQDPFTTVEGNPNLIPEKSHAIEGGISYKSLDFVAGYTYIKDPLDASALRGDDEKSYVLKPINLAKSHNFNATLSLSFTKGWWTSNSNASLRYAKLIDNTYNFKFSTPKPQVYLYTSNTFNVNSLFRVQLLAWYMGARYNGIFYRKDYSTITLGIEKDLFNKALTVKLLANDLFNRYKLEGDYTVGATDVYYRRDYGNDYFRFMATWNFGKLKQTNYKNKSTGQSETNRAN